MESILTSIKKLLGIEESYEHFDPDIIIFINTAFSVLNQLGVGPKTPFRITDKSQTWDQFLVSWEEGNERIDMEMAKAYVYLKTRLTFDPPTSSAAMDAFQAQLSEIEWRLNVLCDDTWLDEEVTTDETTTD